MSDALDINILESSALLALNASLDAIGTTPDKKMRLLMLQVYFLCQREGWGISTQAFMERSAAIFELLQKRDERAADFKKRQAELAAKGYHGHPQKRDKIRGDE